MNPSLWRLARHSLVCLLQATLAAGAIWFFLLPTQTGIGPLSFRSTVLFLSSEPFVTRYSAVYYSGDPIPWSEYTQEVATSTVVVGSTVESREVERGPKQVVGRNLALPPIIVLVAISLPPVALIVATRVVHWIRRKKMPQPLSRTARLWCIVWLASAAAVCVAWLEAATAELPIRLSLSESEPSRLASESRALYREFIVQAIHGRHWLKQHLPDSHHFSDQWQSRTWLTLASFISGALVGCLMFRPWRHTG